MTDDERKLRKMLAFCYSGIHLYGDDGELQDNRYASSFLMIDFKRDSVDAISRKMYERGLLELKEEIKQGKIKFKNGRWIAP